VVKPRVARQAKKAKGGSSKKAQDPDVDSSAIETPSKTPASKKVSASGYRSKAVPPSPTPVQSPAPNTPSRATLKLLSKPSPVTALSGSKKGSSRKGVKQPKSMAMVDGRQGREEML
jgi:hypothetical protein